MNWTFPTLTVDPLTGQLKRKTTQNNYLSQPVVAAPAPAFDPLVFAPQQTVAGPAAVNTNTRTATPSGTPGTASPTPVASVYDPANDPAVMAKTAALSFAPRTATPSYAPAGAVVTPTPTPPPVVDQMVNTPAERTNLFSGTAAGIGDAYADVLGRSLTGTIYDPLVAGSKEAMARQAANQRASTAGQIAAAGFAGTGIGKQIGAGTEGALSKQRYDTMIGAEKARVEGQLGALGEARAYGLAEEGIREFDVGQSNWQKLFDQQKLEYGDTQNWKDFEAALTTGSDADVIAAYKAATGKDLNPASVATYRGYYRRSQEQGLEAGGLAIQQARQTLDTMKTTAAGTALSTYLGKTLDADMSDPAVPPLMQAYWTSLGNTGPMPAGWAEKQIKAFRDVRLNTEQGQMAYQADQLFAEGLINADQRDAMKAFPMEALSFFKRQPDGTMKFDAQGYLDSLEGGDSTKSRTPATPDAVAADFDVTIATDSNLFGIDADKVLQSTNVDIKNKLIYARGSLITDNPAKYFAKLSSMDSATINSALGKMEVMNPRDHGINFVGKVIDPDGNVVFGKIIKMSTNSFTIRLPNGDEFVRDEARDSDKNIEMLGDERYLPPTWTRHSEQSAPSNPPSDYVENRTVSY